MNKHEFLLKEKYNNFSVYEMILKYPHAGGAVAVAALVR
jgi:hypothetical protein